MGEEKMEVEETALPEEPNQEVDANITLQHKLFLLSNPNLCERRGEADGAGPR